MRASPAEAAALFETALGRLPPNDRRRGELLLKTGDAWQAAGQPGKAAEAWEKTVALAPGDLGLHRRLADNYEKNGLPAQAIGHYEYIEAHADPAGRAGALRELGRLHESRGEFDAARDALERGLALTARDNWLYGDPANAAHPPLPTCWPRSPNWKPAGAPPSNRPRATLAVICAWSCSPRLRVMPLANAPGWKKIVALSPRDRDSTLKLARLLADDGEREPAAALYDKLLAAQPTNLELILARADLDVQMGHPDAAVCPRGSPVSAEPRRRKHFHARTRIFPRAPTWMMRAKNASEHRLRESQTPRSHRSPWQNSFFPGVRQPKRAACWTT